MTHRHVTHLEVLAAELQSIYEQLLINVDEGNFFRMSLNILALSALTADLTTAVASINATISGDVASAVAAANAAKDAAAQPAIDAAVAAAAAADQAVLDAEVANLQAQIDALKAAISPPVTAVPVA